MKVYFNKLPMSRSDYLISFKKLYAIHSHSTRSVSSNKFYVQRRTFFKTNQSLGVSGVKIWNEQTESVMNKILTTSHHVSSKLLKNYYLCAVVVVVVWRGISSKTDGRTKAEGLSFYHPGHQTAWVRC